MKEKSTRLVLQLTGKLERQVMVIYPLFFLEETFQKDEESDQISERTSITPRSPLKSQTNLGKLMSEVLNDHIPILLRILDTGPTVHEIDFPFPLVPT